MSNKIPITSNKFSKTNRQQMSDFFLTKAGKLYLQDGTEFSGQMPLWQDQCYSGEVVFNTGMTGYVESLTDPSYTGQILVFTFPLIGNYGVNLKTAESNKIHVKGVVVSEATLNYSHSEAELSLLEWLHSQKIPILTDVDTRSLTKYLRSHGTMAGAISASKPSNIQLQPTFVSVDEPIIYNESSTKKVILVDCGAKENIVRSLQKYPVQIKRVPYNYDYTNEDYDGVLISNGPGDPLDYVDSIENTKKALQNKKPIFGICLGSQIIGLAAGAKTYKLKFGHRGHNQPCLESATNKGVITSQNHGYALDEKTLPKGWFASYKNLNDGSVEGIQHKTLPYFAVQFHPEAAPGPTDTQDLFERFYNSL